MTKKVLAPCFPSNKKPCLCGDEVTFIATVESIIKNELICAIEATVGSKIVATGKTGQKMLKREKLRELFRGEY